MTNKEAIERFMAQEPHLTEAGFFQGLSWPRDVRRAKFQEMREAMLTPYCMDQFERSCEWLKRQPRTKNLNRRAGTSYAGDDSIRYLTGGRPWPEADTSRWGLFRNPLPPSFEDSVFRDIRRDAGLKTTDVVGPRYDDLRPDIRGEFLQEFAALAQQHNPIVRRIVRRTRPMLEERGLLKRIGVIAHPRPADGLPSNLFDGQGLVMGLAFTAAHEAAEQFSRLYAARRPGAGFLKTILLRRIGSSARAGLDTTRHLLDRLEGADIPEDERGDDGDPRDVAPLDPPEIRLLREVERNLVSVVDRSDTDPKVEIILHYLRDGGWLVSVS